MFCRNCGSEIQKGEKFCPRCGTPAAAPGADTYGQETGQSAGGWGRAQTENTPETQGAGPNSARGGYQESGVNAEGYQQAGPYAGQPPHRKKKIGKKVIIPVAAVVVVAAAGIGAFAFTQSNFFRSKVSSPEEYYRSVEEAYIEKELDALSNAASRDDLNEISASIELEDAGVAMLGLTGYISEAETDALGDLEIRMTTGQEDGAAGALVSLYSGDESVISANTVVDEENGDMYLQFPELSESYIQLSPYAETGDFGALLTLSSPPGLSDITDILPKYLDVMLDHAVDVEREDTELTVGDITQDATLLTVTTKGQELKDMAVELMEMMQTDEDLKDLLVELGDYMAAPYPYAEDDGQQFYEEFMDELTITLENAREEDIPDSAALEMEVWVDGDGNIIGRTFTVSDDGDRQEFYRSYMAEKDGAYAYELSFGDISNDDYITLEGDGTKDGKLADGDFRIMYMGEEMAQIQMTDYDVELGEKGYLNGSFHISSDADPSIAGYGLQIDLRSDENTEEAALSLTGNDVPVATLNLSFASGDSYKPAIPEGETVYDSEDERDMEAYQDEINLDSLETQMRSNAFLSWIMDNM